MKQLKLFLMLAIFLSGWSIAKAQEPTPMDTLAAQVNNINTIVNTLKKIKLTAYIQSQYQIADTTGAKTFAGGDFSTGVDNRFKVRRAEFKTMYDNGKTQIVANIDITQGGVLIKDAYGKFTEQWLKAFSVTAGIFNRPFGYEVPTSSSVIGSPERTRANQILFPGERDLGAMLTFQMPKTSKLNPLKIEGGLFNGSGNRADDFDFKKDFIGNIHWNATTQNQKISYGIGASFYDGGWRQGNDTVYNLGTISDAPGFVSTIAKDSKNSIAARQYYGFDAQFSIDQPLGVTSIRGEYVAGKQPGVKGSVAVPSALPTAKEYNREAEGVYVLLLQNVYTTPLQILAKYDWWDPNTKVSGKQLTDANGFSQADIKYTDLGLGLIYNWDANVKIIAYYDMVTNETTGIKGYMRDLPDNIWTFRIQYKF